MFVHESAQQGIDLGLISRAARAKPFQNICVDAECDLLLRRNRLEVHTQYCSFEHLGRPRRNIREIDIFVAHCVYALPISLGTFFRSSPLLHV